MSPTQQHLRGRLRHGDRGVVRSRALAALAVTLALIAGGNALAAGSGHESKRTGHVPELGPLVSGMTSYVRGAHVWTGYAYNDKGASTSVGGGGAATYPASMRNAANLIQLQLAQRTGGTQVTAILETLVDPSLPLLGVGFDTDNNARTGAPCLPGGSWTCKGALGLERLVVVDSRGARMMGWTGSSWKKVGKSFAAKVDPTNNTVSATIPSSLLRPVSAAPTRVVGVLGLTTSSWLTGGPIYNLAFVHDSLFTGWQDATQADVLSGNLDAVRAVATIDPHLVAAGATRIPPLRPGYHVFLYHSRLNLPEGINPNPAFGIVSSSPDEGFYLGPYQPYAVWVSAHLPKGPAPLLVVLHGAGSLHTTALSDFKAPPGVAPIPGTPSSTVNPPGQSSGLFDVPGIMVSPLARGEGTYDYGIGEKDILDVIDDIERRVSIDRNRVVLSGISLGSLGTWRIGELYPDRFSALVPIVAASEFPPEYVFVGRHIFPNAIENVANLPIRALGGRLDPLADPFTGLGQERDFERLVELGYDVRFWSFLRRNHEVVPGPSNCVLLEMFRRPRVVNPARVVYTTERGLEMTDPAVGLDLRYRSAYWVSQLVARTGATSPAGPINLAAGDPTMKATIEVVSLARKDRATTAATSPLALGENVTGPSNVCGTQESGFQGQDAWYEQRNQVTPGPRRAVSNGLEMTLTNLSAATFDLHRASVSTRAPVTIKVTGDGQATLTLLGPWSGQASVTRDGQAIGTLTPGAGRLALGADFSGTHTFVLTPVRAGA